jgi:hypothetical protein
MINKNNYTKEIMCTTITIKLYKRNNDNVRSQKKRYNKNNNNAENNKNKKNNKYCDHNR